MSRLVSRTWGLLWASCALAAAAQTPAAVTDEAFAASASRERETIRQDRATLQASLDAEEQACHRRFFANSCLKDVQRREREALSELRRREIVLEEAERQRRQAAALARIADKQRDQTQRALADPAGQAAARQQDEQQQRQQAQAERQAQALERRQQQAERERAAAQRARAREEAAQGRARSGPSAPLPVPAGPSPER